MTRLVTTSDPFGELMPRHIYKVVLICSEYDQFLIEEDGRVEEELFREYTQLGLTTPPKITFVRTVDELSLLLASNEFDLVVTMLELGKTSVVELAQTIKNQYPDLPIVALSPSPSHHVSITLKKRNVAAVDYLYYWQGNPNIFLAMIKLIEDKMNALHDAQAVAEVPVIILVENSIRFYSSYLPILYTAIIQQTRMSMSEGLNPWATGLRMRGRPKILLAQNYEEAIELYSTFKEHVLGIITDINFEREGVGDSEAGLKLCHFIRSQQPNLPLLLQSTKAEYAEQAKEVSASFIWKLSSSLLNDLKQYLFENYGFGPFVFKHPETGVEITRAENLRELQHTLPEIPIESFINHANRNDFSRWLKARSLYVLANLFRPYSVEDYQDPEELRNQLITIIKDFRSARGKGVIAQFNRDNYDELSFFSRIGSGSLGGKGRGLAFIDSQLRRSDIIEKYPSMYLSIPRTVVIATDLFSQFMEENDLYDIANASLPDETLRKIFLSKPLPEELMLDLERIIKTIKVPIAVRSSSMLEDSLYHPFAGVYETCMLPNTGTDAERLQALASAITCVYASVYYNKSKAYLRATNHMVEEERMAVIIQQVIGSGHGNYWYPNFAGVARSLNFYPVGTEQAENGVGMLCFGFGKTVVDDGVAFRFSPTFPKRNLQYLGGMESSSQNFFYGLDMTKPYTPDENPENLAALPLSEAEQHPEALRHIASTFDPTRGVLVDQLSAKGQKVITFNSILKYNSFPIAAIIKDLLTFGEKVMSTPIEIEFAGNLNRPDWKKPEFSLLQIRPIVTGSESADLQVKKAELERAFIVSHHVMGNGYCDTIKDIIYIKTERYNPAETAEMVLEIEKINTQFIANQSKYILIVAGRLGSSDPWLGIPVVWSQISQAAVIIETNLPEFQVEPSQGTHFFQNITSLGTIYLTVNPTLKDGKLDFNKISQFPCLGETNHFRHIQAEKPFIVKADGRNRIGIVAYFEEDFHSPNRQLG
ncbi:MAG: PEP/pyruvate-binding domain-containing protein [Sphaerochaetaceae bacterium]|jgi:CheY-like chemotaxis protein|nr:PEP/pyruvate-binding domain-containing protein [Sphaerochaetaceae bacterium]MDY0372378.1 PEP/pyruvate-binding domain-containing protein [Sphaerochaetaceae bacterium]